MQFVATKDIGFFGAQALLNAENPSYKNQAIGLAGDELTAEGLADVFRNNTTNGPSPTFGFMGSALMWGAKEFGVMIKWFAKEGYGADIAKNKRLNPGTADMATWIKEQSSFDLKR